MRVLLDTNILVHLTNTGSLERQRCLDAVKALTQQGHQVCLFPQVLYEFWVVATRPAAVNGLGLPAAMAAAALEQLQLMFVLLAEDPAAFAVWQGLVVSHSVLGRAAHDARLVASMECHQLQHLVTINGRDFQRYTSITMLSPDEVIAVAGRL